MGFSLTVIMNLQADPTKAAQFFSSYDPDTLRQDDPADIRELQLVLTEMGLHVPKTHTYYGNGVGGTLAQNGLRMAQELHPENIGDLANIGSSAFTTSIIEDTARLLNDPELTPYEVMQLQQNLVYLSRVDALDGGAEFDIHPGKIDGYLGSENQSNTLSGAAGFVKKYGIEVEPGSALDRRFGRYGIDYSSQPEPVGTPQDPAADAPASEGDGTAENDVPSRPDIILKADDLTPLDRLKIALSATTMTEDGVREIQTVLTEMGLNPGGIDGNCGPNTVNGTDDQGGIMQALKDNPELLIHLSKDALITIWDDASPANREWLRETWDATFPDDNPRADWIDNAVAGGNISSSGEMSMLRTGVYAVLDEERTLPNGETILVRDVVEMIYDEVEKYNNSLPPDGIPLDANLLVNQVFQESTALVDGKWTPFTFDAVGPPRQVGGETVRAEGIGQFLPSTGREYGLMSQADRFDPRKAIPAMIQKTGEDTQAYGSQRMAEVAYNGGRAVHWGGDKPWGVDASGRPVIPTIDQWMEHALDERVRLLAERGEIPGHAWAAETYDYIRKTHSDYWSPEVRAEAERLQREFDLPDPPPMRAGEGGTLMASADNTSAPVAPA